MYTLLRKHPYLTLLMFSLFLYLIGNELLPVTDTAESNYAVTAKEMVLSGDWISPQIYGHYWYDKPIFYYWELALSYTLFGFNEMASRLPSALLGSASVLFTYWFARRVYSEKIGWLSAIILGTSVECWLLSKAIITDTTLFLFMSMAIAFFYMGYTENRKYYYLCYTAAAFAVLTKGPIGLLLPGLAALLFTAIAGAWYGLMCCLHGSDFLLNFLGVHNFLRATVSEHPTKNKWYFYLIIYFIGFAPWSFTIPYSLFKKWKRKELDLRNSSNATQLLFIYFAVVNIFFELIATKYTTYTFPGLFSLAILTALLYRDLTWRFERIGCAAITIYTLLTLFVAPTIMLTRSGKEAGQALAQIDTTSKTIAFLHDYRTSTVFYSSKTIYRAEPANKIDGMKPGALSWNAKNVMPFIAEEDLFQKDNVILIAQDKSQEPCLIAFEEARHVSELRIPGLYDLWILQRA